MSEPPDATSLVEPDRTKRCDYCGKEAEQEATCCLGCGTPFPPPLDSTSAAASLSGPQRLGARSAALILLIYFAAQFAGGIFVGLIGGLNSRPIGAAPPDKQAVAAIVQQIMPFGITLALVAGGVAVFLSSRRLASADLRDRSPAGAAWVAGSWKQMAGACVAGALISLGFLALAFVPILRPTQFTPGPLDYMAATPGIPQVLFVMDVLLLAPPIEELLFRGIAYGGFCRSFGPRIAATLVTLLFWLMHANEILRYLPAGAAIATLALVALWFRLRSAAIGPAIAVHFGYNGVIAAVKLTAVYLHA